MAKKKSRKHASELRRGWKTVADLREEAEMLLKISDELAGVARMMEQSDVKRIRMDGVKKIEAVDEIVKYIDNATKALIDARRG